jgi:hypothetical protein
MPSSNEGIFNLCKKLKGSTFAHFMPISRNAIYGLQFVTTIKHENKNISHGI